MNIPEICEFRISNHDRIAVSVNLKYRLAVCISLNGAVLVLFSILNCPRKIAKIFFSIQSLKLICKFSITILFKLFYNTITGNINVEYLKKSSHSCVIAEREDYACKSIDNAVLINILSSKVFKLNIGISI